MKHSPLILALLTCSMILISCSENYETTESSETMATEAGSDMMPETGTDNMSKPETLITEVANPLLTESSLPLNYPQFDAIDESHYLPAFEQGMEQHLAEIDAIVSTQEPADFDNTIVALENSGQLLDRVSRVFFGMVSANTNDEIRAIQQNLAPRLAAHQDSILLNRDLFARIDALYQTRDTLELDNESYRLLEHYGRDFIRAGAALDPEQQEQMKAINAEIAVLQTEYSQNVLSEVNDLAIVVETREELVGLDESMIEAAAEEASGRGLDGQYVLPLLNTSGQPALASLQNRSLRERIHTTSLSRGSRGGDFDNREVLSKVLRLRAERARLLGYDNHADFILEDQTAQTVAAVNGRLAELAGPAAANARQEADDLLQIISLLASIGCSK